METKTSFIKLREIQNADLAPIYAHQSDAGAAEMVGIPTRNRADFDAHWARIRTNPHTLLRAIVVDERFAGYLVSFIGDDRKQYVGYWLGREWWGRGIASVALAQFIALIEDRPLYATARVANPASRRVLEKNGFRPIGLEQDLQIFTLN